MRNDSGNRTYSITASRIDVIKIDQSFVRNINIDPDDSAIIKALIGLGKSLSIRIVAEGIETHAQSAFLAEHGCDYGQGFLFSKAVAAAEVPELISRLKKGPGRYLQDTLINSI